MSCTSKYQRFHGNKFIFVFAAFYLQMDINSIYLQSTLMFCVMMYCVHAKWKKKLFRRKLIDVDFSARTNRLMFYWLIVDFIFLCYEQKGKSESRFCVVIHHYKIDFALKIFLKLAHDSKLMQLIRTILLNGFNIDDFIAW